MLIQIWILSHRLPGCPTLRARVRLQGFACHPYLQPARSQEMCTDNLFHRRYTWQGMHCWQVEEQWLRFGHCWSWCSGLRKTSQALTQFLNQHDVESAGQLRPVRPTGTKVPPRVVANIENFQSAVMTCSLCLCRFVDIMDHFDSMKLPSDVRQSKICKCKSQTCYCMLTGSAYSKNME